MNPCGRFSLFEGARSVAIADLVFATFSIVVISLQLINSARNQNEIIVRNEQVPLSSTAIPDVLTAYLTISIVNLFLAGVLYRGITTENSRKCNASLYISFLSTIAGFSTIIFHGFHLSDLQLVSIFNTEFIIFLLYHLYKVYATVVIVAFVRDLRKLQTNEGDSGTKRLQYAALQSHSEEENPSVKRIIWNIPFSVNHFVSQERFKIDYEACIEYEDSTSIVKGQLLQTAVSFKRPIAVKLLKTNFRTEKHMIALVKEAKLISSIGHHEHILQFFGLCCTSSDVNRGNVMLLLENYPARRLDDFLRTSFSNQLQNFQNLVENERVEPGSTQSHRGKAGDNRRMGTLYENFETKQFNLEPFSTLNMMQWAYQLGSAMEYLHNRNVVLGNLQAKSMVLVKVSRIKLTNFTLASELQEKDNTATPIFLSGKISWQWTALECLSSMNQGLPTKFCEKTEVWSYASTLWEIFSMGRAPNMSMSSCLTEYITILNSGKQPEKPQFASEGIYNLMSACWVHDPLARPAFNIISLFFHQLLSATFEKF